MRKSITLLPIPCKQTPPNCLEKTLKRCNEGILNFDDIHDRIYSDESTQHQKDKLESELKKEIKKLQKNRELIKQWSSNDIIKDKSALKAMRRKIEERMESFKRCEKDSKTKAYSKAALKRAASEQMQSKSPELTSQQSEAKDWFDEQIETLEEENVELEADLDKFQNSGRGKGKRNKMKNVEEMNKINDRLERNKWHLSKLRTCMERVVDGNVDAMLYKDIRDDVEYYINEAMDDEHYQQYDEMYQIIEEYESESDSEPKEMHLSAPKTKDNVCCLLHPYTFATRN